MAIWNSTPGSWACAFLRPALGAGLRLFQQGGNVFQNSHVPGVPTQPALLPDRKGDAEPRSGRRQLLLKAKTIFSVYEFLP